MKKLLILNGSPRRAASSTMVITRAFVEGICRFSPCEAETVEVGALHIEPCRGCLSCWGRTEGTCVLSGDDVAAVKEKILAADLVIASFPLYFFGMPGEMKLLTDRLLSLMCTYRGQRPPQDGSSYHGLRYPKRTRRFAVVSTCAYTDADAVYASLRAQLDCIAGRENYTALFCPEVKTLVEMGASARLDRLLEKCRRAGEAFAQNGRLSEEGSKALSRPPLTESTYRAFLERFWQKEKDEVAPPDAPL